MTVQNGGGTDDIGTAMFVIVGGALIVIGGLVAAVNSAAPFAHGSWLAAYLVLVGGVAQIGLGAGRLGLPVPAPSPRLWRLQIIGWNVGNVGVASGVLSGAIVLVAFGSVLLLIALGGFAIGARPAWSRTRARAAIYEAFALMLAVSVVIGCALADATPTGLA